MVRGTIAIACAALCGCPGPGNLRAPSSLPEAGMTISIYRDRDLRVPAATPVGPVTTSAGYGGGYRPQPAAQPAAAPKPAKSMALVVDRRWLELSRGEQELKLLGVAATLDASSTWVQSLSDPAGTALLAQRYEGATASPDALLEKHVGHDIEITTAKGSVSGRLLGYSPSEITVVDPSGAVRTLPRQTAIRAIGLGDDRSLGEPALRPTLRVKKPGKHLLEVAYEAKGLTWWVDYGVEVARIDAGPTAIALTSRATVKNLSGMVIDNAAISLYAGTLGTKGEEAALVWRGRGSIGRGQATQFQIRREVRDMLGAVEYVYNGAIRDTSKADKEQHFGTQSHGQIRRTVAFENSKALGLGGVLPAGRGMITMSRGDGVPPERHESHLRERVDLGDTARFDVGIVDAVSGERRQVSVDRSANGKRVTERYELRIRNHSNHAVKVRIIEDLVRAGTPTVSKLEPEPDAQTERQLQFVLEIEPRGTESATFEATYRW